MIENNYKNKLQNISFIVLFVKIFGVSTENYAKFIFLAIVIFFIWNYAKFNLFQTQGFIT